VGGNARTAVAVATRERDAAVTAPARADDAFTRGVRVVCVAASGVVGEAPLDDVVGALEHGDVGAPSVDLRSELSKSGSCASGTIDHTSIP